MKRLFDLTGRVAVVTGGARGLGAAISIGLAAFGADIAVLDVSSAMCTETTDAIRESGRRAVAVECDVSNSGSVRNAVDDVKREFGQVDILVNNAGIARRALAVEMSDEEWDEVINVNLKGVFLCSREFCNLMIERGGGSIINIASTAGFVAMPRNANYCAAKGGVIQLTKSLALEWAGYGIRVNGIAPTSFRTDLTRPLYADAAKYQSIVDSIPLGRVGEPNDLVGPAVFLASDASRMVTGHTMLVDGGYTMV